MKSILLFCFLVALGSQSAHAQRSAPDYDGPRLGAATSSTARANKQPTDADMARAQRRLKMNPEEAKRDQQMEILAARSGNISNTSFSRGSGSARQYDKRTGGFGVRKFKDSRVGSDTQKRGQARKAPGIDPKGKPLDHRKKKHRFLFF